MQTTDSRGTTYTLEVPENALLTGETITMTPFSEIREAPVGSSFRLGVELLPEGLELLKVATLRIEPAQGIPQSGETQIVGFGAESDGDEFYLSPITGSTSNEFSIPVYHFSGHGAVEATDGEIQNQQQNYPPTDPRDRASQDLAGDPSIDAETAALKAYQAAAVGTIAAAGAATPLMEEAFRQYRYWKIQYSTASPEAQAALAGLDAAITTTMISSFQNARVLVKTECLNHNLNSIRRLLRWSYLTLIYPDVITGSTPQSLLDDASKCGQFELDIVSSVEQTIGENTEENIRATIEGQIPIGTAISTGIGIILSGEGEVQHTETFYPDDDTESCTTTYEGQGGIMRVNDLNLGLNLATGAVVGGPSTGALPVSFSLSIQPVDITERLRTVCDGDVIADEKVGTWLSGFVSLNLDVLSSQGFELNGWNFPGSSNPALIATKSQSKENDQFIENSEYKLFHRPDF